jgi:hypothetical protein
MNLAGDGLMLVIALHELGVRERAYLNASPKNCATSAAFPAPPPRPSLKAPAARLFFARSTSMDSGASGRGWLAHKRAEDQNHRPARRPFSGCRYRAGLLPTRSVAPRRLTGSDETRTQQVIVAPASFGEARGEVSTAQHETGLRPVDAPFHETSVTGLRLVGQDCSAATPGPSAYAATSSNAPSTFPATFCPLPLPSAAVNSRSAWLQLARAHLVFTARACHRCHRRGWLRRARPAGQHQRPARRTVPSCTRRAGLLASRARPALPRCFPRCRAFPAGQAHPTARPSLHPHTEARPWGNQSGHRRSSALNEIACLAPSSLLPPTFGRRLGYFPTRRCTRPRFARRVNGRALGREKYAGARLWT